MISRRCSSISAARAPANSSSCNDTQSLKGTIMTPDLALLLGLSCIAAAVGVGATDVISHRGWRLAIAVAFVAAGVGVYTLTGPAGLETKGGGRETIAVVFCYMSMLLGMVAQYFYRQAERGAKRFRFKPIEF